MTDVLDRGISLRAVAADLRNGQRLPVRQDGRPAGQPDVVGLLPAPEPSPEADVKALRAESRKLHAKRDDLARLRSEDVLTEAGVRQERKRSMPRWPGSAQNWPTPPRSTCPGTAPPEPTPPACGVSAVLTLAPRCSPWRLQTTRGYPPALVTDGSGRPEIWRAISALLVAKVATRCRAGRSVYQYVHGLVRRSADARICRK